ncbi:Unknown protein [Striga hermonthica]|uniref:Uncharacterized protein n=1 Tax=Striga hermonthica TaxID=68872 RepID=A0A9N7NN60_STRHE|nr:Unknown protein [Striga hermonthica]
MSQEGQTLEKFWSELHNIWTEIDQRDPNPLECCDKGILTYQKIISQKRLYQFLAGLNPQLDGIRRDILKEKPNPSPEVAFATVKREAARLHIMQPISNSGGLDPSIGVGLGVKHPNPMSDPARMQSNGNSANRFGQSSSCNKIDKTKLVCSHCGMKKHTRETCFQLVGYPEWWEEGHRIATAKGKSAVAVDEAQVEEPQDQTHIGFGGATTKITGGGNQTEHCSSYEGKNEWAAMQNEFRISGRGRSLGVALKGMDFTMWTRLTPKVLYYLPMVLPNEIFGCGIRDWVTLLLTTLNFSFQL